VQGVPTRNVDELLKSLGMSGISSSEVSRIAQGLDKRVKASRTGRSRGITPMSGWTAN